MSIDISAEDLSMAEALVAKGHFASVSEVVTAGLHSLELQDFAWTPEHEAAIEEGLRAQANNDFASDEEMDRLFAEYVTSAE